MSAGDETYVADGGISKPVEEMWTTDGLTSRQIQELYLRNPLALGGYDIIYLLNTTAPYVFSPDRRPIFQGSYATNKYSSTGDIQWGVIQQNYRKTPATGQPMDNPLTNGKLRWLNDKVKSAADRGFERFHLTNIAGWTSFSDKNNPQPHFPSNSYTGLSLTSVPVYVEQDSTTGFIQQNTPFTEDGTSAGKIIGDNEEAWTAAVAALKGWVSGDAEVTSYQGYRPCYTDSSMTTMLKTQLGYSKSSTTTNGWTGTPGSPGFTPEPGFDGPGGFSSQPSTFASWFDEEIEGLATLGFDGIGLDTGTRVWDNSGGRANGTQLGTTLPDGTGNSNLINYFNSRGLKPVFEGVGLDTWTQGAGKSAAPATDGRYFASAYWAYFGSWWGYEGQVNGEQVVTAHYDKAGTSTVEGPAGGYFFDTGLCGNASNAAKFPTNSEVHCIFQWGNGTFMTRLMQGTAGDAASGNGIGWMGIKQIMWDIHNAGCIISASGSLTTDITATDPATGVVETITWEMFLDYVQDLYDNPNQARPGVPPDVTIVSVTEPAVEGEDVTVVATTDAGTLSYAFQVDGGGNWLTLQSGSSNVWNVPAGTEGFFWRVIVSATNAGVTDSETFNSSGRVTAPATGPLQTLQWVMTGPSSATVTSSGTKQIIGLNSTTLQIADGPRFWNGSEAGGNFGSTPEGTAWWQDNWQVRIRQDGGPWMVMDGQTPGTIYTGGPMIKYNNIGDNTAPWKTSWVPMVAGQVIDIEVYEKGQMP